MPLSSSLRRPRLPLAGGVSLGPEEPEKRSGAARAGRRAGSGRNPRPARQEEEAATWVASAFPFGLGNVCVCMCVCLVTRLASPPGRRPRAGVCGASVSSAAERGAAPVTLPLPLAASCRLRLRPLSPARPFGRGGRRTPGPEPCRQPRAFAPSLGSGLGRGERFSEGAEGRRTHARRLPRREGVWPCEGAFPCS